MSDLDHQPETPPRRAGERGMVLVITLLMLTILTILGSAAVMRTSLDLREGGAQRIETAAYQLSEAGAMASVALAGQMQGGFAEYMAGKSASTLTMADMGPGMLQLTGVDGSFGNELVAAGAVDFVTKVYPPDLSAATPGYDANRYCFQAYRLVTTSQIGNNVATSLADVALAGQAAISAQLTVGPIPCGQ